MRSCALIAGLVLLLGSAPAAEASRQRSRDLYRKGMAEYVLEHWTSAIRLFEAGFREQPEAAFLYNIAQAHRRAGRPADAVHYFRKYLDFKPNAADRREVEQAIAEQEELIAAASAPAPPVERSPPATEAPSGPPALRAVPPAALPAATASTAPTAPTAARRRWPMWVGIGAGALVVVGGVVALAVAYTTPSDAPIPATSLGNVLVRYQ